MPRHRKEKSEEEEDMEEEEEEEEDEESVASDVSDKGPPTCARILEFLERRFHNLAASTLGVLNYLDTNELLDHAHMFFPMQAQVKRKKIIHSIAFMHSLRECTSSGSMC